jgi:hypothetical protein
LRPRFWHATIEEGKVYESFDGDGVELAKPETHTGGAVRWGRYACDRRRTAIWEREPEFQELRSTERSVAKLRGEAKEVSSELAMGKRGGSPRAVIFGD